MAGKINNAFVVDASFVLSFLLNEGNQRVEKIISEYKEGNIDLVSCTLLPFEVGNGLRTAVLRKRLTKEKAQNLYQAFLEFEIKSELLNYPDILKMALAKNMNFYDASYISLAHKLSLDLLTLD